MRRRASFSSYGARFDVMRRISSYRQILNEFGSKLVELEHPLEEILYTKNVIQQYLFASVNDHCFPKNEEMRTAVENYGIGNYEEALKDYEEFSVIFN